MSAVRLTDGRVLRPWEVLEADLRAVGPGELLLVGDDPTQSPHLLRALKEARARGASPVLLTHGHPLNQVPRLRALQEAGLAELCLRLSAPDADAHDAVAGAGAFRRTMAAAHAAREAGVPVRVGITAPLAPADVPAWVALGLPVRLLGPQLPGGPPLREADADTASALNALWRARPGDRSPHVTVSGLLVRRTQPAEPPPADGTLAHLIDRGCPPPTVSGGTVGVDVDPDLPWRLVTAPIHDLPTCLGGLGFSAHADAVRAPACDPCPALDRCPGGPPTAPLRPRLVWQPARGPAVVLVPDLADQIMVLSTLPAIARAMTAAGLPTALLSAWDVPWHDDDLRAPHTHPLWQRLLWRAGAFWLKRRDPTRLYLPPDELLGHPMWWSDTPHRRDGVMQHFWDTLDLSRAETIVVPGFDHAARVVGHPTRRPGSRVIVLDLHLLHGVETLHQAVGDRPWEATGLSVVSCFPGYTGLYAAAGVPLHLLTWLPYPLHPGHFRPGGPPTKAATGFAGGRHLRDAGTLVAAAGLLDGVRPIDVITDPSPDLQPAGPLRLHPTCDLTDFYAAIQRSRYVVVPLHHDPTRAAGITVIAMALAAGRPVISSFAGGTLDHLTPEADALLVPPGDPQALAAAIRRLDGDLGLLARLADGAVRAAARATPAAWAERIVHGAPIGPAVHRDGRWSAW